jgi:uncharacterized protein (TIGR03437 family)
MGGLAFGLADSTGAYSNQLSSVVVADGQNTSSLSNPVSGSFVWSADRVQAASDYTLSFTLSGQDYTVSNVSVPAGGFTILPMKFPPAISLIAPAAGLSPGSLSVASDSLISLYGAGLAASTAQPSGYPWPFALSDAALMIAGQPARLTFASSGQINALVPAGLQPGLYVLTLTNGRGRHTINLMIEQAVPAVFTLSNNAAAAVHAATGQVVSVSNPAAVGEYVSLYATGLGPTAIQSGLNVAIATPSVFIDSVQAAVTYAGRSPQYSGLDQINIQVPAGTRTGLSVPVVIVSGNRASNSVLLAVK